jgi:amino acid permease
MAEESKTTKEPLSEVMLRLAVTAVIMIILVFLGQMWVDLMDAKTFVKVELTIGSIFLICMLIYVYSREQRDHQRMTNGSSLDE